ncbi:hypothetical protein FI667_g14765, partial [Globisporangium splendens]
MSKNVKTIATQEFDNVIATAQKYVDGLRIGSSKAVAQAFHQDAVMYGFTDGGLLGGPIQNLYDFVDTNGDAPEIKTRLDVLAITPTTAVVRVDMEKDAAGVDYTDFHTLIKINGSWVIVAKVFHASNKERSIASNIALGMSFGRFCVDSDGDTDMTVPQPVYEFIAVPKLSSCNQAALVKWSNDREHYMARIAERCAVTGEDTHSIAVSAKSSLSAEILNTVARYVLKKLAADITDADIVAAIEQRCASLKNTHVPDVTLFFK